MTLELCGCPVESPVDTHASQKRHFHREGTPDFLSNNKSLTFTPEGADIPCACRPREKALDGKTVESKKLQRGSSWIFTPPSMEIPRAAHDCHKPPK